MHSIIVSTGYSHPGAQYFHGILVESTYISSSDSAAQNARHISNQKQNVAH